MKRLGFIFMAIVANAGLAKPHLADLNFLNKKGQFVGASSAQVVAIATEDFYFSTFNGEQDYIESSEVQRILSQSLSYGVFERLTLHLGASYLVTGEVEETHGPASIYDGSTFEAERSGARDPEVGLEFRLYKSDTFNADFEVEASIGTGDRESPTVTDDGNGKSGGTDVSVAFQFVKTRSSGGQSSYRIGLSANGEKTSVNATSKEETIVESSTDFFYEYRYGGWLSDKGRLTAILGLGFLGSYRQVNSAETVEVDSRASITFGLELAQVISDGGLTLVLGVLGTGVTPYDYTIDGVTINRDLHSAGQSYASLRYAF